MQRAAAWAALLALTLIALPGWVAATNRHELEGEQCLEAIQPGPCRGSVRRWAFNAELGRCAPFWWGGCQPNGNNFLTKAACNKTCRRWRLEDEGHRPSVPCALGVERGHCRAHHPRWYFDALAGECRRFIYSGCGSNSNNFFTKRACQTKCMPHEVCKLPPVVGPCLAYIPSFYYDPAAKECKGFVYGGCKGNGNRFPRLEDCEEACGE